jgi:hypothetical protein
VEDRIIVISDYHLPINPKSERILIAVKIKPNEEGAVRKAVEKWGKHDETIRKVKVGDHVIWELIQHRGKEEEAAPAVDGVPMLGPPKPKAGDAKFRMPNSAVTVAHGYLLRATHVDFLKRILQPKAGEKGLAAAEDFDTVMNELAKLGAGSNSFRFFTRTDEEYRVTYELIKAGEMPQAETVLGKILNKVLGDANKKGPREQRIDGEKLPDYNFVRNYLGPAGLFVISEDDGWFIKGCLLRRPPAPVEVGMTEETDAERKKK